MEKKYNILFFHPSGLFYGGTEKLLQMMAKYTSREMNVYFAYCPKDGEQQKFFFDGINVTLVPFNYRYKKTSEPYTLVGMKPGILEIINRYCIDCVCLPVFARYQFPVNAIPAHIPIILTSPFGHYTTNGNVRWVFVSGPSNWERLYRRGIKNSEAIFDPLEDFPGQYLKKPDRIEGVVFGRVGRPDDNIFDPVSILAFSRLEKKYGNQVLYRVVGPPPKMKKMAEELGVRNIEYIEKFSPTFLAEFYQGVDVLAHARHDGETFGKAIAEAMLAGLPIITHKSHYHNEHLRLLNESYARWSEPDDVDAYYLNMEWFVEHKEEIRSMGKKSRQYALDHFSPEKQFPHITQIFLDACQRSHQYSARERACGYLFLWWNNFKAQPLSLARRTLQHFPKLQAMALKIYSKI